LAGAGNFEPEFPVFYGKHQPLFDSVIVLWRTPHNEAHPSFADVLDSAHQPLAVFLSSITNPALDFEAPGARHLYM